MRGLLGSSKTRCCDGGLLRVRDFQLEEGLSFEEAFEKVSILDRPNPSGCSSENQISLLKREKGGDLRNEFCKRENHVRGVSFLKDGPVISQFEREIVNRSSEAVDRYEFANHRGIVECLRSFPGVAFGFEFGLQITSRKVDPESKFGKVIEGLGRWDALPGATNAENDLDLMMDLLAPCRNGKRFSFSQDGRFWLEKNQRARRNGIVKLLGVGHVVSTDANDLHPFQVAKS